MAKRIYPNWCNCDWSQAHEDENDIDTYFSTMGALAGHEHLYVRIDGEEPTDISIQELFEYCQNGNLIPSRKSQIRFGEASLEVSALGKQSQEKSGMPDAPGVYSVTYIPEDVTYIGSTNCICKRVAEHKNMIEKTGGLDAGPNFGDTVTSNYRFDVLEITNDYIDAEKKYIESNVNININGLSQKFYNSITQKNRKRVYERPNLKVDLSRKQELIDLSDYDIKVLDIGNKWVKVKHIFKNDYRNTPAMMHIWYKEFDRSYCLSCTEDHPLWTGKSFTEAAKIKKGDFIYRADGLELEVTDVSWHWCSVDSYDIGTESGTFIGSGIMMHNCRTMIGYDRHGLGYKRVGRGNIFPTTIILPKLGIEYGICLGKRDVPDIEGFWKAFEDTLKLVEKSHIERFEIAKNQTVKAAPFMYDNGTIKGYDECQDNVYNALKHGTFAIGYIGIAEMCEALFGENHVHNDEVHKFALSVVSRINKFAKEASERNDLNFSCYATPKTKMFCGGFYSNVE